MAHVYEVTAPTHAYGTAFLSERIRKKSDTLDVTVYPTSQLGSESELLEQLVAGELDLAITGPSFLAMWHPPIGVFDAAFASRDLDQMLENQRSEEMKKEWDTLREKVLRRARLGLLGLRFPAYHLEQADSASR